MISCANKILCRLNNILSRRNKLKNKTSMSLPGFHTIGLKWTKYLKKKKKKKKINIKTLYKVFNRNFFFFLGGGGRVGEGGE